MMEGSLCAKQRQICVYMSRAVAAMENTNIMSTVLLKGHFTFFFIFIYLFIYFNHKCYHENPQEFSV